MEDRSNPYRVIESGADAAPQRLRIWSIPSVRSLILAVTIAGATALVVLGLSAAKVESPGPYFLTLLVGAAGVLPTAIRGVSQTFRDFGAASRGPVTVLSVVGGFAVLFGHLVLAAGGGYVALVSAFGGGRGRQLRRRGRVLLPTVEPGAAWAADREAMTDLGESPSGLADRWRENARTEHASVAAFAHLALDLMALGAPPRLIAAANEDGLDEIRHAEACFALARVIDGRAASPVAFPAARERSRRWPSRALALAELAVESLVDGALHEGVSARTLAKVAERCESEPIRRVVKQLAADEGRHAAHGWDVVVWCLAEGGWVVEKALTGALRALPAEQRADGRLTLAASGAWERWGIPGRALEQAEYRAACAHLVARLEALLASRRRGMEPPSLQRFS